MHHTMFDTPVINTLLRWISLGILRLRGWKVIGEMPKDTPKCVMIAAPHTSNWDLPFTLMVAFGINARVYWMGKEQIFKPPFRRIMMWMGGIPVDRSKANNMVQASVDTFGEQENLVMIVPPEGTRSKVTYWKTGFYHIANGAGVPIALGFLDYARKEGGVLGTFETTGDVEKDMEAIKARYAHIGAKKADLYQVE